MSSLLESQRAFFRSGISNHGNFRLAMLDMLELAIQKYSPAFEAALMKDLGKSVSDVWSTELGPVLSDIKHARRHVRSWMRRKRVFSTLSQLLGRSYILERPFGSVLILAPWNYPIQLALAPLVAALAAGNTITLKPSELTPHCSTVLADMIKEYFSPEYIAVVEGDATVAKDCLEAAYDMVFFTGSTGVGKEVAKSCASQLIPCVLELGGKSPVVLLEDADLELAAKRIGWAKVLNAGQTCVAPDYVLVPRAQLEKFTELVSAAMQKFAQTEAYGKIVGERHWDRLATMLAEQGKDLPAGSDRDKRIFMPSVVPNISTEARLMKEEIFGPILPILAYDDLEALTDDLQTKPSPLALYVFSRSPSAARRFMQTQRFGGGCINDLILHVASPNLPFGGVGPSGWGRYHGRAGLAAFSYSQAQVEGSRFDLPLRYPPHDKGREQMLKRLMGAK